MRKAINIGLAELTGAAVLGGLVWLFLAGDTWLSLWQESRFAWPVEWLHVKTLFLSILLEAIPFVLLGVFFSALIQTFVTEEQVKRWTPARTWAALPFAATLGFLFPVCECAIVPVVRRLIMKGMPLYAGVAFLLAGPIVNPVVMASTYTAFLRQPEMVVYRSAIAWIVAVLVGWVVYAIWRGQALKRGAERTIAHEAAHHQAERGKLSAVFAHAVDEFFDMGKYLIAGALISSVVQVYVSRETLLSIGQTPPGSHLVMMGMAYVFSLCSEADAFIAASFGTTFHPGALLAFLVFGPMIDLKNTLLLLATFRVRFVAVLLVLVFAAVLAATLMMPWEGGWSG